MRSILKRAQFTKVILEIIYIDQKGIITQRAIRVMDIKNNTVTAYCFYRDRKRTFRLENILSATMKADRWKKHA
ncbi:hypothetical protein [Bacillus sp. SM2101]|uniref:hypothetical protein n=1 Tax=Bacillus sp. SM2101 TaxID=2805366 RepID=UPI001BDED64A|nr:hypothetical protein [Bacillus sp. SM2101]